LPSITLNLASVHSKHLFYLTKRYRKFTDSTTLVFDQFYKKAILENRLVNHKKQKAAKPHKTQTSRVVVALPN
jgi:hypothetical protein